MRSANFEQAFAESMEERMVIPLLSIPDYHFPKKFERKMRYLFKHPSSFVISRNKLIPLRKILIYAIIAAMLFTLTFTAAAYWEEIKSFFMVVFADHSRITYSTENETPERIEHVFFPEYTPAGYAIVENNTDTHSTYFFYESDTGYFTFEQQIKSFASNINSELSDVETVYINGFDGYYIMLSGESSLTWATDEYIFRINGSVSKEESLKIAESVVS